MLLLEAPDLLSFVFDLRLDLVAVIVVISMCPVHLREGQFRVLITDDPAVCGGKALPSRVSAGGDEDSAPSAEFSR